MKTINIQNEANIKAKGNHTNKNAKAVVCIETGEIYVSAMDAAEKVGVHPSAISLVCLGKTRSCKGKHFCYLSRVAENLDSIVTRLRETSAIEEDAKRWQAYQAEQEAIRKAEEERRAEITKAEAKVARLTSMAQDYEAKWHQVMAELTEAEKVLAAMHDNAKEVA